MNQTDTNLNHESNFHYFCHGIGFVAEEYEILGLWYLFEEHDYFSTRMHARERAGDALLCRRVLSTGEGRGEASPSKSFLKNNLK